MKRNEFIPFTLELRDIRKKVDPETWKKVEPHVQQIITLIDLYDKEYNKESRAHFRGRELDGDFDDESVDLSDKTGVTEDADLEKELLKFKTDDYQNRGGDYPESDEPVSIDVYKNGIICSFKNTDEVDARMWLSDFLNDQGFTFKELTSHQTGDYYNDWVTSSALVTGYKESKSINSKSLVSDILNGKDIRSTLMEAAK